MGRTYFVSGIDTGVGKTIATGMMARSLMAHGIKVTTVKLVETGCHGFSGKKLFSGCIGDSMA